MTKVKLIQSLQNNNKLNKKTARASVDIILNKIINAIHKEDGVEVRGFGSFTKRHRPARVGINPKTGNKVEIEAKDLPFFKPGKELKKLVNMGGK